MAIVSFSRNFVFVKTTKTAGTSIEVDLSKVAGDDAIVTPIYPPVEGHIPRNHAAPDGTQRFFNHMPARQIREFIGADTYNAMTVFCVEREPVAKCISDFHMQRNSPLHNKDGSYKKTWAEYVEAGRFPVNTGLYSEGPTGNRHLIVNRILRYDTLSTDLTDLMGSLGVQGFSLEARAKSEYSQTVLIRPEDVTPAQRALIYDAFAETFALTGIDWSRLLPWQPSRRS